MIAVCEPTGRATLGARVFYRPDGTTSKVGHSRLPTLHCQFGADKYAATEWGSLYARTARWTVLDKPLADIAFVDKGWR